MMRLSCITDEISQDLGHALQVLAGFGTNEAELRNVYGKYIVDADEALLTRVENDLKQAGMRVACLDTPLYKCDLETQKETDGATHNAKERTLEDQLSLLQHSIDLCKRFDTQYIRIFSFWRRGTLTPEIEERIAAELVRPCQVAERAGITLLLENEHACYTGTGAETRRMIEMVASPALKMVWDPGNAFMAGEQPFPSGWENAAPYAAHIHIKDAHVGEDGKLHWCRVGEGDIDYVGQFNALRDAHYDGVISLETHWGGPNGDKEAGTIQCLESLKKLIGNL
jgi:sugar phosphate isomerase/epimerase